jgi:hypothetical protein
MKALGVELSRVACANEWIDGAIVEGEDGAGQRVGPTGPEAAGDAVDDRL